MHHWLEQALYRTIRAYTFRTPIRKGKYRAFMLAQNICTSLPEKAVVPSTDGRLFRTDLSTGMHTTLYFLGEYEKAITDIFLRIIGSGQVCIDVGANFGWYTTLFSKLVGSSGRVHAFEPMPPTFDELLENLALNGSPANVSLSRLALGEVPGELSINLFPGLTTGHASLADHGRTDHTAYKCTVNTLDNYLLENETKPVDLVKVDIEGAELMFLRGASALFKQDRPPTILMEMALNTTKNFGYLPNDLIHLISSNGKYAFYRIDDSTGLLDQFDAFADDDIGANVLCIPEARNELLPKLADLIEVYR